MNKTIIALMAGGDSSERDISLNSAAQTAAMFDKELYEIFLIDLHGTSWSYRSEQGAEYQIDKNDFTLTVEDRRVVFDYALILIHGTPGEDGRLQGYFDMMGIKYLSCDFVSSVLTFDKSACKRAVADTGVALAKEIFIQRGDKINADKIVEELGLPLFVKPNASGSSFGVTKVKRVEDIEAAVNIALKESNGVLIEEFIEGVEVGCGVAITSKQELLLPITEIVSENEFFDYEAKYTGRSQEITPARISEEMKQSVHQAAARIYQRLGCRGLVRIDFIIKDNVPYMVEVNSIPGMSKESIIPKQLRCAGVDLIEVYEQVMSDICLK